MAPEYKTDAPVSTLEVDFTAPHWPASTLGGQADAAAHAATTSQALAELLTAQVTQFLARVTTPAGAYVTRRLQEAAPYY